MKKLLKLRETKMGSGRRDEVTVAEIEGANPIELKKKKTTQAGEKLSETSL